MREWKKQNAEIKQMSNLVQLLATAVLMTCVMLSMFLYLTERSSLKGVLGLGFMGLVVFIVMRGLSWLVGGFQQKTYVKGESAEEPVPTTPPAPNPEDDPTTGSRFLHEKKQQAVNPFMPT